MNVEDNDARSAHFGRPPSPVAVVARYAQTLTLPGLAVPIETRLTQTVWPFRSLHTGWGATCCQTTPRQPWHAKAEKGYFLLLRPELVYKSWRYNFRSAERKMKEILIADTSTDPHMQARTPTYSDAIPVRTNYWVKLAKELLTLTVFAHYRALVRDTQQDLIALLLARHIRQIFTLVVLASYLGGHIYYAMNPKEKRLEGWRLGKRRYRKRKSSPRQRDAVEVVPGGDYRAGANTIRCKSPSLRRRQKRLPYSMIKGDPDQSFVRSRISINTALNRLGRALVHKALVRVLTHKLSAFGRRACSFRQLKRMFRSYYPQRTHLSHLAFDNLKTQLHGHDTEVNIGTMLGGGPVDAGDKELFLLYLARLGQLSSIEREGDRKHQSISITEFRSLSRNKKLLLFHEIGLHASSLDTVKKFYRKEDPRYPDTHTDYATPTLDLALLTVEEILHHHMHIEVKIKRLKKIQRGLHKEMKESYRSQIGMAAALGMAIGTPTAGYSRMDNIMGCNQAIANHAKLLKQIQRRIKAGMTKQRPRSRQCGYRTRTFLKNQHAVRSMRGRSDPNDIGAEGIFGGSVRWWKRFAVPPTPHSNWRRRYLRLL